jgi:exosortase D (VPLPA-CTERM-specific)
MAPREWLLLGALLLLVVATFFDGVVAMVESWAKEEYGYGYFIPLIAGYLIWLKRARLAVTPFRSSWTGATLVVLGLVLGILGELSTLYTIVQYGFLLTLWGTALAALGREAVRVIWGPLFFLFFMIPLPDFIYNNLSAALQVISSQLGVALIRAFGIAVHLQGNVIDLGDFRLQVVEACSGLRYLFPLTSLAFLCAYLYKAPLWQRTLVVFSAVPITVVMNSVRIGVIGILVEYWGSSQAEGFLHDFEGVVVFMACLALLLALIWLLARLCADGAPLSSVFGFHTVSGGVLTSPCRTQRREMPVSLASVGISVMAGLAASTALQERAEHIPKRAALATFPLSFGGWQGRPTLMQQEFIDALKFDDYLIVNYGSAAGHPVNFYVAYYGSQRKGQSAHSPLSCIPGDGWLIKSTTQTELGGVEVEGSPVRVNRLLIEKGETQQLVYYWFQQRGRVITNEYLVKWYLFWDALTRNRSDGALVRLTTVVDSPAELEAATERLREVTQAVAGELDKYVPGRDA